MRYLKIFAAAALFGLPILVLAAQTLNFNAALTGGTYNVNGTVDSIIVTNSNISQVLMSSGQSITLTNRTNTNDVVLSNTTNLTVTRSCTASPAAFSVTLTATGQATTTIDTAGSCAPSSGTSSGGASASATGGGGVISLSYLPGSTPATTTTQAAAPVISSAPAPAVSAPSAAVSAKAINKELSFGSRGNDVKTLQDFLAKDKKLYPEGLATGYYGPATTRAVKRFQKKYGIPQVGRVGPATLKKLNELISGVVPASPAPAPAPTPAPAPAPAPSPFQYNSSSKYF